MHKNVKITETQANGYSPESTWRELSNEYQHDRVSIICQKSLHSCALDESSLSIGRVKGLSSVYKVQTLFLILKQSLYLENQGD